jgi:TNF receptor-associated protein 1
VQAIWAMSKAEVTEEQYTEFYKYKSNDFEPPLYRLHFESDAPIAMKALLYVGSTHEEKYGMGRIKPGVDLYSRKVLIEAHSGIIPDWLRFLHGVVDSEDIPLNISRETMQDSALVRRLRSVLTRRALRFLDAEARRDPAAFNSKFFAEFGNFLKEGAVTDAAYSADIAKLLRFESSALPAGTLTSFDDYISRCPPGQNAVYYLVAPHRGIAEASPYMEAFRGARKGTAPAAAAAAGGTEAHPDDVEVLFLYSPIDDFVMNNLREFNGRKLVTAEAAELDPAALKGAAAGAAAKKEGEDAAAAAAGTDGAAGKEASAAAATGASASLTPAQVDELGAWLLKALPKRLGKVRATTRLRNSPAVVTDHESAALRRMMRMVEQTAGKDAEAVRAEAHMLPKQTLEINPAHPVVTRLFAIREAQPELALVVAEQIVDNALVAAGLVDDARTMLPRLNAILERVLGVEAAPGSAGAYTSAEAVSAKRYTSPREADERAGIELGQALFDDLTKGGSMTGAGGDAGAAAAATFASERGRKAAGKA